MKVKESITQVALKIISILIAFGIDRAYDSYRLGVKKKSFIQDQIVQLEQENKMLVKVIKSNEDLKEKTKKGSEFIENVDSLVEYTQWLGKMSFFKPEISSLSDLSEIYGINDFVEFNLKKDFQGLYWNYDNIEFYENIYSLEINKTYIPFWRKNYNAFKSSYPNKKIFKSDDYLNIVQRCLDILIRRIDAYKMAMESQKIMIGKLKEAKQ